MHSPLVSVLMPVFNGATTLQRALSSVSAQSSPHWELVVVDDGSTDGSPEIVKNWAAGLAEPSRCRLFLSQANRGPGAARNTALEHARGEWIAYLDCDDRYHGDYVEKLLESSGKGDLLFFGYDMVDDERPDAAVPAWDPAPHYLEMFRVNLGTPLGVAHRRDVAERLGGFDETLWQAEDWDLWRRIARTGAAVAFLPLRSGVYHIRPQSRARSPRLTALQQDLYESNRKAGLPLYHRTAGADGASNRNRRVTFASGCFLFDPYSGAALATARWLSLMSYRLRMDCDAVCATLLDASEEVVVEELLADDGVDELEGFASGKWRRFQKHGVRVTFLRTRSTRHGGMEGQEAADLLSGFDRHLEDDRPDVLLSYGGDPLGNTMLQLARRRDIPIVYALHNFAYRETALFQQVDHVVVPSDFSRRHYWNTLGVHSIVLPNVVDPRRVVSQRGGDPWKRRYVTFVNPHPTKGVFLMARIVLEMARRRPDVPFLFVESRGRAREWMTRTGVDLSRCANVFAMPATDDPREFYSVSRLVLMPSLWWESFGMVAAEAMANGIPVLASDRGALPEIVGDGGQVLSIPEQYKPESTIVPSAAEAEPWIDAICRLWDDESAYRRASERAKGRSTRWHPDVLGPKLLDFFRNVRPQPNPPFVPRPWPINE